MSVLVDELLLLAQLDAGRPLAQQPVDLTRLAIDATSDARVAAGGHRWLLELPDEPILVRGDEHRLHQVLANLMSNAAKHTPKDTVVTLALTSGEAPGTVELSVTDDGPGIPAELQPTLFERFVRGDSSRARGTGGAASTGLGLAIVDAVGPPRTAARCGWRANRGGPGSSSRSPGWTTQGPARSVKSACAQLSLRLSQLGAVVSLARVAGRHSPGRDGPQSWSSRDRHGRSMAGPLVGQARRRRRRSHVDLFRQFQAGPTQAVLTHPEEPGHERHHYRPPPAHHGGPLRAGLAIRLAAGPGGRPALGPSGPSRPAGADRSAVHGRAEPQRLGE